MGCGPGHVARYLQAHNVQVCGVDLSAELVERARRLNPGIEFQQGDMMALDIPDEAWVGIVAFYSLIHIREPIWCKLSVSFGESSGRAVYCY